MTCRWIHTQRIAFALGKMASAVAMFALFGVAPADAALTWSVAGPTNNWSTAAADTNWTPGGVFWAQGESAIFGATAEAVSVTTANTVDNITFGASWTIGNGAGSLTLADSNSDITVTNGGDTATIAESIAGAGSITKLGGGTLTLSSSNTYAGGTTVNGGTVNATVSGLFNGGNAPAFGTGDITINSGATVTATVVNSVGGGQTNTRTININGGTLDVKYTGAGGEYFANLNLTGGTILNSVNNANFVRVATNSGNGLQLKSFASSTSSTFGGRIDMTLGNIVADVQLGTVAGGNDLVVSGQITQNTGAGSGNRSITKNGDGRLVLTGASSSYTGGTMINAGTVSFANGSLGTSGAITMNGGALRWETGNTQDISGRFTMVNGKTAAVDTNGNNVAFASAFGGSTSGALQKIGSGTLTLSNSNTYSGGTTVNEGTVIATVSGLFNGGNAPAFGTGDITINSGATVTATVVNSVGGGQTNTRTININGGTLDVKYTGAGGEYFANLNLTGGTILNSAGASNFVRVATNGGSGLQLKSFASSNSSTFGGRIDMTLGNIVADVQLGTVAGGNDLVVSGQITQNTGAGSGNRSITKNGDGRLVLTGASSSYTGGTMINAGTVSFANGSLGASGAITMNGGALRWETGNTQDISGRFTMVNGKTATIDTNGNNVTFNGGAIGGGTSGALRKIGGGTLTLRNTNTYSGATTIDGGTLTLNATGALFDAGIIASSSQVNINSGATLQIANAWNIKSSNVVVATGGTIQLTSGTSGDGLNYMNNVTLNSGSLLSGNAVRLGYSTNASYAAGGGSASTISARLLLAKDIAFPSVTFAEFNVANATGDANPDLLISGVVSDLSGSAGLTFRKAGVGTLALNANNTYVGATQITAGTLLVNGTHTGGGLYTVGSGATLGGGGSISAAVTVAAGGATSPGNSPGTLTVGSLDYDSGAIHHWEITGAYVHDILNVTGLLNFDGLMTLNLYDLGVTGALGIGDSFVVWDYGTLSGFNAANFTIVNAGRFDVSGAYVYDNGSQILISGLQFMVPEPSTLVLAAAGMFGMAWFARRRIAGRAS